MISGAAYPVQTMPYGRSAPAVAARMDEQRPAQALRPSVDEERALTSDGRPRARAFFPEAAYTIDLTASRQHRSDANHAEWTYEANRPSSEGKALSTYDRNASLGVARDHRIGQLIDIVA